MLLIDHCNFLLFRVIAVNAQKVVKLYFGLNDSSIKITVNAVRISLVSATWQSFIVNLMR